VEALILAAGRGERLRPLTDRLPKPLLTVGGRSLVEHQIVALARAGIREIVVNYAHLGELIVAHLGDGEQLGVRIRYSDESDGALETGGGIARALNLLRTDPFVVVNGDIWTDFDFGRLLSRQPPLAHLVLVDNPEHNRQGDFRLADQRVHALNDPPGQALTFSGIGVYRRKLFTAHKPGRFSLAPLLRHAIAERGVTGEHHHGRWIDVGTRERLATLRRWLE
jgi:MurNAc alpha-1-phosphate uridylyltransferase